MLHFHHTRTIVITGALVTIGFVLFLAWQVLKPDPAPQVTTTVTRGEVTEVVAVSGFVEAPQTAALAFPTTGIVTEVAVARGDTVEAGQLIASLASAQLVAERAQAVANLQAAEANLRQLQAGPRTETIALADASVASARQNLNRVTTEQAAKVDAARAVLYSSNLEARTLDPDESSIPPVVSGTYTCDASGSYTLTVYRSEAESGYSYRFRGLENGTAVASSRQPAALGSCGLFVQFVAGQPYGGTEWVVEIPNTRSSTFISNQTGYEVTQTTANAAVDAAADALTLAEREAGLTTAATRSEDVLAAAAAVAEAHARVAAIDANLADRSILAPFAGTITDVDVVEGETATQAPVVTLLAEDAFELKARVPEIDITQISLGQAVEATFDAESSTQLGGTVSFISPIATEIDGVAYFEIIVALTNAPTWLRAGLNADVDVIVAHATDVLRVPRRFITSTENPAILVATERGVATTTVTLGVVGNDGFVEITGVAEGTTIVAP